jgi:hypothetical protein
VLSDKCGLERTASGFILIALAGATLATVEHLTF